MSVVNGGKVLMKGEKSTKLYLKNHDYCQRIFLRILFQHYHSANISPLDK